MHLTLHADEMTMAPTNIFVVVEEMDCDRGGGADVIAAYDDADKADAKIAELEAERDSNPRLYKHPTGWFVVELEMNKGDRWS